MLTFYCGRAMLAMGSGQAPCQSINPKISFKPFLNNSSDILKQVILSVSDLEVPWMLADFFADQCERWKGSLSEKESKSVRAWMGVQYDSIRAFQRGKNAEDPGIAAIEASLSSALSKAVACRAHVYRGLSASVESWQKGSLEYLQGLIDGPEVFTTDSHDSATTDLEVGRSYTRIGPEDESRDLSVLLCIRSLTARHLYPFEHEHKDELEVVLLRGTTYRRRAVRYRGEPRCGQRYYEVDLEEVSSG